jgi:PLP dependent protein
MPADIADNIAKVRQRIRKACIKSGRPEAALRLLAVSKTQPSAAIRNAVAAGIIDIGENYWQEAEQKMAELTDLPIVWHFIGPLQTNKTRAIAAHFDWVHSVDRLKLAERLAAQRPAALPPLNICLQVNINEEPSKAGVHATELPALAMAIANLPQLRLRGLMAIPQASDDIEVQRGNFKKVRQLLEQLQHQLQEQLQQQLQEQLQEQQQCPQLDTLSMGMSGDLEAAIAEGSTLLRIGTDIFGARPRSQAVE